MTKKTVKQLAQNNETLESALQDKDFAAALEAVSLMEGGKLLIGRLTRGILDELEKLAGHYNSYTLQEFIASGANIQSRLMMLKLLTGAEKEKRFLSKVIKDLIEEELLK